MKTATPTPLQVAEEAWGPDMPDWVRALAVECMRPGATQRAVAEKLGRTGAVVTQVLRRTYGAAYDRIEERVRGVFMDGRVECPSLGEVALQECQDWREKARVFSAGNPLRSRMFRACRACPRYVGEEVKS